MRTTALSLAFLPLTLSLATAQGPRSPRLLPSVEACQLHVKATIDDRAATTEIRQTFHNPRRTVGEALWLLPIPEGAAVDGFEAIVNGQRLEGEVLDSSKARSVYESIVRRRRDPALLEYVNQGCIRARVAPIPAGGRAEVIVRYRHVLPATAGLRKWSLPLRGLLAMGSHKEGFSVDVAIDTQVDLGSVFSSLANADIVRKGKCSARLSWEGTQLPKRDPSVFFTTTEKEIGLGALSWKKGKERGYFMMTIDPKRELPKTPPARTVQFVVDVSGSMKGAKIEQAKKAMRFFVKSLRDGDRFNLIPFSTVARPLFETPSAVTAATRTQAAEWIDSLEATGGTNIEDALTSALGGITEGGDAPLATTVFVTDGQPTLGERDPKRLIKRISDANKSGQRVFVLGVGHGVNSSLLDRIADATRGSRDYVLPDEDLEITTSALFDRLRYPALTDLALRCEGAALVDVHPKNLPDLFHGDQLVVLGRYTGSGPCTVVVDGRQGKRRVVHEFAVELAGKETDDEFVRSLWAKRRIAFLLDSIRMHGQNQELVAEVKRLGTQFGITTPYTSHLLLEAGDRARLSQLTRPRTRVVYRGPGDSTPPTGSPASSATPGRAGPATGGPATPGPAGPTSGGGGARWGNLPARERKAIQSASDDFFMGFGGAKASPATKKAAMNSLISDLQRAGALPQTAGPKELQAMLGQIGTELMDSEQRMRGLQSAGGKAGVDASLYMLQLAKGRGDGGLASLLTRRIHDRTFRLSRGVWRESGLAKDVKPVRVEAFSKGYFDLIAKHKHVAKYLAFSTRMILKVGDQVVEVFVAAEVPAEDPTKAPAKAGAKNDAKADPVKAATAAPKGGK